MLKEYCQQKVVLINAALKKFVFAQNHIPAAIYEAMSYSLFAGGKRLRPILLMAAADAVGSRGDKFINMACGLEMIHTYSLIHDDLPAMDNDDYRRGKLTNHKVFGEAMAILAGDGLLTLAFEVMLNQPDVKEKNLLLTIHEIAVSAGARGMVGGQALDLMSEGRTIDVETLRRMHEAKTGALFGAALRCGGLLGGATDEQLAALTVYAQKFGLAFQITDDILDVTGQQSVMGKPVGSDEKNHKATYVSLYSLSQAKSMAEDTVKEACEALNVFDRKADILRSLALQLLERSC